MVRLVALGLALFVLATGLVPHVHEGTLGRHACVAFVTATCEAASCETPDLAPRPATIASLAAPGHEAPARGFPRGAVSGQSPPVA